MLDASAVHSGDPEQDVARINAILRTPGYVGLDFETTIARAKDREICTIQVEHEDGRVALAYVYHDWKRLTQWAFRGMKATPVAHNSIFEMECMANAGVYAHVECTMVAAKVLRGKMEGSKGKRTLYNLAALMEREFGKERDKTIRDRDWREPLDNEAIGYCLDDSEDTLVLWRKFLREFEEDPQQYNGYRTVADSFSATVEGNLHGLPFDAEAHDVLVRSLTEKMTAQTFYLDLVCYGEIENHGSPKQVAAWMMEFLLDNPKQREPGFFSLLFNTATGQHWPMTDTGQLSLSKGAVESRLKTLTDVSPTVASYLLERLQYSKVAKLKQAFGESLRKFVDDDGYIRCTTKPHGAQTSREACAQPNLQQIPKEEEFRLCFKAKRGRKLVICDYGQIELRVGAIIANDTAMMEVFHAGVDIHQATATKIKRLLHGEDAGEATPKERKASKPTTFASLYGAMASTIAINSGLTLPEAEMMLDAWLEVYPGIRAYRETAHSVAQENGGCRLVSGQFIRIAPDTRPAQAINAPVQGSSASVMYRAKKLVHDRLLVARDCGSDIWYAASVHDELILDAAEEDAAEAQTILQGGMLDALLELYPRAAYLGMDSLADADAVDTWAEKP